MTKVIERTGSMLDTPPQDKLHKHLHIFHVGAYNIMMQLNENDFHITGLLWGESTRFWQ